MAEQFLLNQDSNSALGDAPSALESGGTRRANSAWPDDALIILPRRSAVLFPLVLAPLSFRRGMNIRAVEESVRRELPIGVICQRGPATAGSQLIDLHSIGTSGQILRVGRLPNGLHQVIVQGAPGSKFSNTSRPNPSWSRGWRTSTMPKSTTRISTPKFCTCAS